MKVRQKRSISFKKNAMAQELVILPCPAIHFFCKPERVSFASNRCQRINFRSPPCRKVAGQQRHRNQQRWDQGEGQRIGRADAVKEPGQNSRQAEGRNQPERHAAERQPQPLPDNQP
jgi:hypothetical protein